MSYTLVECKNCEYCTGPVEHLNNECFEGRIDWGTCDFPRPIHLYEKAITMNTEHNCPVFILRYSYRDAFAEHIKPYENGRKIEEGLDIKILEWLSRIKLNIASSITQEKDMDLIGRSQRLLNDLSCLIHIWKKKEGSI